MTIGNAKINLTICPTSVSPKFFNVLNDYISAEPNYRIDCPLQNPELSDLTEQNMKSRQTVSVEQQKPETFATEI